MKKPVFGLVLALSMAAPALATESTTYTYDDNGRLISATHTGSVNNNVGTYYTLDAADNRTNITVTTNGSPPAGWPGQSAVVPAPTCTTTVENISSSGSAQVTASMITPLCTSPVAGVTFTVTSPSLPVYVSYSLTKPASIPFTVSDGHGNTASATLVLR